MKTSSNVAEYVKRNRFSNYVSLEDLTEHYGPVVNELRKGEKIQTAFVGTIYGIPKLFVGITKNRVIVNSLEKKPSRYGVNSYLIGDDSSVEFNDRERGIVRFYMDDNHFDIRVEPCYAKRIAHWSNKVFRNIELENRR